MMWIFFAALTLFLWITGNVIDKYLVSVVFRTDEDTEDIKTLMFFSTIAVIPIAVAILIGWYDTIRVSTYQSTYGIIAGVLNGVWLWFYFKAIARSELSRVLTFFQLTPLFGVIFGLLFLGELLRPEQLFAGGLVLLGGVILSFHFSHRHMDWQTALYMSIAAAALSAQMVTFKLNALASSYANTLFWTSIGLVIFTIVLGFVIPRFFQSVYVHITSSKRGLMLNIVNETVDNGANLSYFYAGLLGPVALVQTMVAFQPALILAISWLATRARIQFLQEDFSHLTFIQKLIGVTLTTIGGLLLFSIHV